MLVQLRESQWNHRVALYGLGGIGKTQTALAFAHWKKEYYQSIFWISGADEAALLSGFQQIAIMTGCVGDLKSTPSGEVARKVIRWIESQEMWLLIIDNLDDIAVANGRLPAQKQGGHTLITTRNPNTEGIPAQGLEISVLPPNEATDLFCRLSNINGRTEDEVKMYREEGERIAEELGHLPLAIEQAAAYLRETGRRVEDYLPLYQKNRSNRRQLHRWTPEGNRLYQHSVATTWKLSFEAIQAATPYPHATLILRLFAFLSPDILLEFVMRGTRSMVESFHEPRTTPTPHEENLTRATRLYALFQEDIKTDDNLRLLQRFSLIQRYNGGTAVKIHRLVQEVIQCDLDEIEWLNWWELVVCICLGAFPSSTNGATQMCRKYEGQVTGPLSKCPELCFGDLPLCCDRVAHFLWDDGKFTQAKTLFEKTRNIYQNAWGPLSLSTVRAIANVSTCSWSLGLYDEAIAMDEHVFKCRRDALGPQHRDTLTAMANLAMAYKDNGWYKRAVDLQESVYSSLKQGSAFDNADLMQAAGHLASSYRRQGRWEEALKLQQKVLKFRIRVLGERDPGTIRARGDLGLTWEKLGRWDESFDSAKRVLEDSKEIMGEKHPNTLIAMANLARMCKTRGEVEDVLNLERNIMQTTRTVLGGHHPATLKAMTDLASTYRSRGNCVEALELLNEVYEISKIRRGETHPEAITAMANIAHCYWEQGRFVEAVKLEEKVLDRKSRTLGECHPETLMAMSNLALSYGGMCRYEEAIELQTKIVKTSTFKANHPEMLKALGNLAWTYGRQGDHTRAMKIEEQVYQESRTTFGETHPETLVAMGNLAWSYTELADALALQEPVLAGSRRTLGEKHPDTCRAKANLARTYWKIGKEMDALRLQEDVVQARSEVLGGEHPETRKAGGSLAEMRSGQYRIC